MMRLVCITAVLSGLLISPAILRAAEWRQFRGTDNTGVAPAMDLPTTWTCAPDGGGENVAWRADLPGQGVSSPIVVSGRVVVTASSGAKEQNLHTLCFDAKTGKPLWSRQIRATGRTLCHATSSVAANTPASDGEKIVAMFSSNDVVCLDLEGNVLWIRGLTLDHPAAANDVGMAASPLIVGDTVVVQVESKGDSFAAGLSLETGETRWQIPRFAEMNWTSPAILRGDKPEQLAVLLQSTNKLTAHEPATGRQLWEYEHACREIPSPVAVESVVYFPAGEGKGLTALKNEWLGEGANSVTTLLWRQSTLECGNASPVIDGDRAYALNRVGVLTCGNTQNGEVLWRQRLKGTFWETPVISGDRLYVVNEAGEGQVVQLRAKDKSGKETGEIIGGGNFNEQVFGSPAIADGGLFVRSHQHLWKIAKPEQR